ncbi:hypothetical protein GCK72_016346 [Caenorhabditis remanei]|uniref:CUB-like domain-containing protein n=1 Tax=Caenorhabditis remanei TaxID=31234 RepID=A0A6A5GYV8_CAERE|nr:hypothetical protein GCK72_016346 [Caenorhabditis remanei]KAF1759879.1 hypothetical protein GCK72_016346 [Caenorhabditis remanei]
MLSILILSVLTDLAYSEPHIFYLNKYPSGVTYAFDAVEDGANLYLASNDDNKVLMNIKITTGGKSFSLDQLNDFNDDGSPKSIKISGGLDLSTTNIDSVTNKLTGYLHVTTRRQADDSNFHVYVIKTQHFISASSMKSTVVILNTQYLTCLDTNQPLKNSYVTQMDHSSNTNLYFQWGIPAANWTDVTNNVFFSNPINLKNDTFTARVFFNHVEPIQVGLDFWYFTVMGPINMIIENKYVNDLTYQTTAANTTGLVMTDYIFYEHTVNFQPDRTKTGSSGFIERSFPTVDVGYYMKSGSALVSDYVRGIGPSDGTNWTPQQADKLTVNSSTPVPGTFYCQYFTFTGDLLPTTTPQTSTLAPTTTAQQTSMAVSTTTVATTTKESSDLLSMKIIILLSVVAAKFL